MSTRLVLLLLAQSWLSSSTFVPPGSVRSRKIICLDRTLADVQFISIGVNDNYKTNTTQEVCAATAYGGRAGGYNVGGFCLDPHAEYPDQQIGFQSPDITFNPELPSRDLANPFMYWMCAYRCRCAVTAADEQYFLTDTSVPTIGWDYTAGLQGPVAPNPLYELHVDQKNTYGRPPAPMTLDQYNTNLQNRLEQDPSRPDPLQYFKVRLGFEGIQSRRIRGENRFFNTVTNPALTATRASSENAIVCEGSLPIFAPREWGSFTNLQEMCAAYTLGGARDGNAGGFCWRSRSKTRVWFTESHIPDYRWSYHGGYADFSIALRFYCWQNCNCQQGETQGKAGAKGVTWDWGDGKFVFSTIDGSSIHLKDDPNSNAARQVWPQQQSSSGRSSGTRQRCLAVANSIYCPQEWDNGASPPLDPAEVSA